MTIQGNLHGYILKALEIAKSSKALIEETKAEKLDNEHSVEYRLHANLSNIITLLVGIENLDEDEVGLLKQLLAIEHEEGEELHEILSMTYE